eukprot:NODE_337_length_1657_cov_249.926342.p1 GENE.NODE_337_length_1657_cov_249.926342~~NODE_337_length_1657_cov_249.926342.p1  ORF type:complete len:506 (+),score=167.19 NODE_337_length_1657_cov_249.926342:3-1520(+)
MGDHDMVYLTLDNKVYVDGAGCIENASAITGTSMIERLSKLVASLDMREEDLVQACYPSTDCNPTTTISVILVDESSKNRLEAFWATLETAVVIVVLLAFMYLFHRGVRRFSRMLLQPLRSLVDDMTAVSSLDLVHIDADRGDEFKYGEAVHELQDLQTVFKRMRCAIRSWSKFVPPSVVEGLLQTEKEASLEVEPRKVTILFCDIDGFEDACRGLAPNDLLSLLARVLGKIADLIEHYNGTLLEFIGDEVLAVFNAPSSHANHVRAAVATCLHIHHETAELPGFHANGELGVRCRCGVHTANMLAGNIGSQQRMKYGLLGDGINLCARLKGLNSRYGSRTLSSDPVLADEFVRSRFVFRPLDLVAVKGKKQPTTIYEILGFRQDPAFTEKARLARLHGEAFQSFHDRNFVGSKELFTEVCAGFQALGLADEPSKMLAKRCNTYIKCPPPPDWDGVERLTKKSFAEDAAPAPAPVVADGGNQAAESSAATSSGTMVQGLDTPAWV